MQQYFGQATVCLRGQEYNPWWGEPRLASRVAKNRSQCIQECVPPRVRNPATNYCWMPPTAGTVPSRRPVGGPCKYYQYLNARGHCQNYPAATVIAMGFPLPPTPFYKKARAAQRVTTRRAPTVRASTSRVPRTEAAIRRRLQSAGYTRLPRFTGQATVCPQDFEVNPFWPGLLPNGKQTRAQCLVGCVLPKVRNMRTNKCHRG